MTETCDIEIYELVNSTFTGVQLKLVTTIKDGATFIYEDDAGDKENKKDVS